MKARIILTAILFLAAVTAKAENGWNISASNSGNVTTFTITRTNTAVAETVKYRLVNLSAYAGQHYYVTKVNGENKTTVEQQTNALSGEFTFSAGENTSRTIQVTESTGSGAYTYYKDDAQRSYKLEITDAGGFYLTSNTRSFTKGTSVPGSGAFDNKEITIQSSEYQNSDAGYDKNVVKSVSSSSYFNSTNVAAKAYYQLIGAELRMTLSMDVKEKNDGYQYMSILTSTSLYDNRSGCSNGDPGNISNSLYMAGFEHKTGGKDTEYKSYSFPVTSVGNNAGHSNPWGHGEQYILSKQKFNTNCRASDGRLLLPMDFSVIAVRCNASGGGTDNDEWYAKNVKASIQAVDGTAPTKSAISVAPGYYAKGNTVYVSVAFNEIVKVTGTPKLTTENNWGELSYVAGDGTNVLTFSRTISANASGNLNITGLSCTGTSTVKDLAGNDLVGSGVTASNLCSLDASYAYTITYDLDEGSVASANPTTYTWETATFTLNNPTKFTYYFNGWTGSNGNTPQRTVTIANHSHGNKSYTADWTQVWTGSGTQGDPYTITTTKGLDLLAQYVNSGNTCKDLFFQLGGNITYTHNNDWNVASEENNYTAIGTDSSPFQGTFDGNNYTISGIRIYKAGNDWPDKYQGLFGNVKSGGMIKRVNLSDSRITGPDGVGGIAGHVLTSANIQDCTVDADVCIHAVQSSASYHGGIVGFIQSPISRCISRATLTVADASYCKDYGGIAGITTNTITDCIADGVVIPDVYGRGAIVGYHTGTLTRNYYRGCTVAGVANAIGVGQGNSESSTETSDVTGAHALWAITLPEHASLVRSKMADLPGSGNKTYTDGADIAGVPYATASAELSLSYNSASIPSGYALASISAKETSSGTAVALTDNSNYTYTFTMPAADVTVTATLLPVISYIDADGQLQSQACTAIVGGNYNQTLGTEGKTNWYVVSGEVSTKKLTFKDAVTNIILCDGATLSISVDSSTEAIYNANGSVNIFAQSGGSGAINVPECRYGIYCRGDVIINGGTITFSNASRAGIFTAFGNANGDVTIRRGRVDINSSSVGINAIYNVNILGGIVNVTSSDNGVQATNGTITLGCPTAADRIYASSYSAHGDINVATGQTLTDGNSAHSYTDAAPLDAAEIAGKTLMKALGSVSYIDENGTERTCTEYTILSDGTIPIDDSDWGAIGTDDLDTWYVASGNYTFNHDRLESKGHVHLILCDGATFTVSGSLYGIYAESLTIYGQSAGTGSLVASTTHANGGQHAFFSNALTINGGNVSTSSVSGNGIFGSSITINGGTVNATGANRGIVSDNLIINGGNFTADGSDYGIFLRMNAALILGWTSTTDRIYVSKYGGSGTISIKDGQGFNNGSEILSGTITDKNKLNGKTLVPVTNTVAYIDADGSTKICTDYTTITSSDGNQSLGTDGGTHWYVVSGDVTINGKLTIIDRNIHLILSDGSSLTVVKANSVAFLSNGNLTIYGQSAQDGTLTATSSASYGIQGVYNITVNGGSVSATSNNASAIYSKEDITINRGAVSATGYYGFNALDNVTINGGTVNTTGAENGIYCNGNITLGWTRTTDRIYASSYGGDGTISIKSGQAFSNGTEVLSGTITDMSKLDGKTLRPAPAGNDVSPGLTAHQAELNGEEYYWATFYNATWNYRLPYGAQAFIYKDDEVLYRVGDGTIVPAGCAVVIMAHVAALTGVSENVSGTLTLTATTDAPVGVSAGLLEANILRGVSVDTDCRTLITGTKRVFVLGSYSDTLIFRRLSSNGTTVVPAGKAYFLK